MAADLAPSAPCHGNNGRSYIEKKREGLPVTSIYTLETPNQKKMIVDDCRLYRLAVATLTLFLNAARLNLLSALLTVIQVG